MKTLHDGRLKASLIILVTFLLGTVTGVALDGMYRVQASDTSRDLQIRAPAPFIETLRRDLNLTDAQIDAIRKTTADTRRELRDVRLERCPGFADVRQRLVASVRLLLTAEQQKRFDAMIGERQMRNFPARGER